MNPYESPTHCEEAEFDWLSLWFALAVAAFVVGFIGNMAALVIQRFEPLMENPPSFGLLMRSSACMVLSIIPRSIFLWRVGKC